MPSATKVVWHHMYLPITGKTLPLAVKAQRRYVHLPHHGEGAGADPKGHVVRCTPPIAGKALSPNLKAMCHYELPHLGQGQIRHRLL